jgi:hypothetical protein
MSNKIVERDNDQDCECTVCEKEIATFIIYGHDTCYYCGNKIFICDNCLEVMLKEIEELKDVRTS